jgi:hypothetical protein
MYSIFPMISSCFLCSILQAQYYVVVVRRIVEKYKRRRKEKGEEGGDILQFNLRSRNITGLAVQLLQFMLLQTRRRLGAGYF